MSISAFFIHKISWLVVKKLLFLMHLIALLYMKMGDVNCMNGMSNIIGCTLFLWS